MYRVSEMSGDVFAIRLRGDDLSNEYDIEDIEALVSEGTPVILCESFDQLEGLGIETYDITVV